MKKDRPRAVLFREEASREGIGLFAGPGERGPFGGSGGVGQNPWSCLILREGRRSGHHALKFSHGNMSQGLQDLLVVPAGFPRFLMEVDRRVTFRLEGGLEVGEQRLLARVR